MPPTRHSTRKTLPTAAVLSAGLALTVSLCLRAE